MLASLRRQRREEQRQGGGASSEAGFAYLRLSHSSCVCEERLHLTTSVASLDLEVLALLLGHISYCQMFGFPCCADSQRLTCECSPHAEVTVGLSLVTNCNCVPSAAGLMPCCLAIPAHSGAQYVMHLLPAS